MKKIVALFCFAICMQTALAPKPNVDSILQKVAVEKDEDKKVDLLTIEQLEKNNNQINEV